MAVVLDASRTARALGRIAHEVFERNCGIDEVALVGIRTRGVPLARPIAKTLHEVSGQETPCGALDITLYRDDLSGNSSAAGPQPVVHKTPSGDRSPRTDTGGDVDRFLSFQPVSFRGRDEEVTPERRAAQR